MRAARLHGVGDLRVVDEPAPAVPAAPAVPSATARVVLHPLSQRDIRLTGGFWAQRQALNRSTVIELGYERLEAAGNLDNLRVAGGTIQAPVRGPIFMDSDVYKWLEAAAWEYGREPDPLLLSRIREVTAIVTSAQAADGYLDSVQQVRCEGRRYNDLPHSHEHYCAGHLIQAAVAQARCTPDRTLLDVATRLADHLATNFGPGRNVEVDGHPVVETALVELFRQTGRGDYRDLAAWFVEARGHGSMQRQGEMPTYFSDRLPVRAAATVEGHAVRAVYLRAGAADVAAETADNGLHDALVGQWEAMTEQKMYLTGGLGSRWDLEQFGDPYELAPDRAYAETCAAIGSIQWSWRMLLATGQSRYADLVERTLFNAFAPGVSLDGTKYFYVNALQVRCGAQADDERSPILGRRGWFGTACCPPNVMRTLSSLDTYLATTSREGLQVHQFATATISASTTRLSMTTSYPWQGQVRVEVLEPGRDPWELAVRVPGWARGAIATLNGEPLTARPGEYLRAARSWSAGDILELSLPMNVRVVRPHPRIDAVRGCVALERGPLVYCVEQADLPDDIDVDDLRFDAERLLAAAAVPEPDLLGGVTTLVAPAAVLRDFPAQPYPVLGGSDERPVRLQPVRVRLIPYCTWANRAMGAMRVWLPCTPAGRRHRRGAAPDRRR